LTDYPLSDISKVRRGRVDPWCQFYTESDHW